MSLRLDQTTIQTSKKDTALKVHNQSLYSTHFPSVYDTSEINFSAIFSNYLIKITYYCQMIFSGLLHLPHFLKQSERFQGADVP